MAKSAYDLPRLIEGLRRSKRMLQRPRERRYNAIQIYAGDEWGAEGIGQSQPVNFMSLYTQIMLRSLVAKNPRFMYSTFQTVAKASVATMERWANKEVVKMNLADILRRWAMDALFSVGIIKVGLATPPESAASAWGLKAGSVFAKTISLDDLYVDPQARHKDEVQFIAHQYRVPLDTVRDDSTLYGKSRLNLTPSTNQPYNDGGDEKTAILGRGTGQSEDVEDMVDLVEVYCPAHRSVKTLALDQVTGGMPLGDTDGALREIKWLGPDWGPYLWMGFGIVADNIMPKAPIQDLIGLHDAGNNLLRKLIRQGKRQKNVLPVSGANAEDMTRLEGTDDGFGFRCDNPAGLKELNFGGPNQQNFAMFMAIKDLFSFMGGNLDLLGGRGAQSPTATQDKMLNENASVGVTDMQDTMVNGAAKVAEALSWFWWHDPFKVMRSIYQVPGLPELSAPESLTPQQRMAVPWDELDVRIDPYSMQHSTPQSKLAQLNSVVTNVMPMMQMLQQQGVAFDVHTYLEKVAKYLDLPDLKEIFTLREPVDQQSSSGSEAPGMPASTERTYNRVSSSEQTDRGHERNLMSSLMGVDPGGSHDNGNGQS